MQIQRKRRTTKLISLALAFVLMLALVPVTMTVNAERVEREFFKTEVVPNNMGHNEKFDKEARTYTLTSVIDSHESVDLMVTNVIQATPIDPQYPTVEIVASAPVTITGKRLYDEKSEDVFKDVLEAGSLIITEPGEYEYSCTLWVSWFFYIKVVDETPTAPIPETPKEKSNNPLSNPKNLREGAVAGSILNSDIMAYINGNAIPSWNVDNKTVVVAEDLVNYGFDVVWSDTEQSLKIAFNSAKKANPIATTKNTKKPGSIYTPYVASNIRTYIAGTEVQAYNVGGQTLVNIENLGASVWNDTSREIKITVR